MTPPYPDPNDDDNYNNDDDDGIITRRRSRMSSRRRRRSKHQIPAATLLHRHGSNDHDLHYHPGRPFLLLLLALLCVVCTSCYLFSF